MIDRDKSATSAVVYVLGRSSATLLSLRVDKPEIRIHITGPQMMYSGLRMLTSLELMDGCSHGSVSAFAKAIEAQALCGLHGTVPLRLTVPARRTSPVLEIDTGPKSMYPNDLIIRTRDGTAFEDAIRKHLAPENASGEFVVGLEPLPGTGHGHQHHEAPTKSHGHKPTRGEHAHP